MNLAESLLKWYDENHRELPWRQDQEPYKIWVSEVMLQQTRVEAVRPYYERWMERFPTLQDLAQASEEEVLQYWQGLGYYSRARNLHRGVREVAETYDGQVPQERTKVLALSGVGDYTAGAILSIAYNKPEPAVDGNVLRVFSRLYCLENDITKPAAKKQVTDLVSVVLPLDRPGDFNQAIMDLGSLLCTPKNPDCTHCPLNSFCLAYQQDRQRELPLRKKNAPPRIIPVAAAIVQSAGQFLLCKRPGKGILANMWEFPAVEIENKQDGPSQLESLLCRLGQQVFVEPLPVMELIHTFSHRQWQIAFYPCKTVMRQELPDLAHCRWVSPNEWSELSFAGPHRKMAAYLESDGMAES
ncbi:A/G-specific DNA-adenine glycosylase [Anaerospora hongkongensis]|uniref:Adenine DNA glycosylase n=1 Tax=Anaerospora hongkongensis TaxID=244830 RepID=A0A4R1QB60_9FIRM|nr:A/G-specific adenine glycosylase [Anaerospora hongkongensis]TCL39422.1 A/G-specific DNA-adenine glycosylase [Anaerospora hongkongensis]